MRLCLDIAIFRARATASFGSCREYCSHARSPEYVIAPSVHVIALGREIQALAAFYRLYLGESFQVLFQLAQSLSYLSE